MSFGEFGKHSGPRIQTPFAAPSSLQSQPNPNPLDSKSPTTTNQRRQQPLPKRSPVSPHSWDNQPKIHQRLSHGADSATVRNPEANFSTAPINFHAPTKIRSPPLPSRVGDFLNNYHSPDANIGRSAASPHSWDNQPKYPTTFGYPSIHQRLSPGVDYATVPNSEANFSIKPINFHAPMRTRPPPLLSRGDEFLENYHSPDANTGRSEVFPHSWDNQPKHPTTIAYPVIHQKPSPGADYATVRSSGANSSIKPINFHAPLRTRSPPLSSRSDGFLENYHSPDSNTGRPAMSPRSWDNEPKEPANLSYPAIQQRLSPVTAYVTAYDAEANNPVKSINFHVPTKTQSPPLPSRNNHLLDNYHSADDNTVRPGFYTGTQSKNGTAAPSKGAKPPPSDFQNSQVFQNQNSSNEEAQRSFDVSPPTGQRKTSISFANSPPSPKFNSVESHPKASYFISGKRARSPPVQPAKLTSSASPIEFDTEREMLAKAKRLARFNIELSQPMEGLHDFTKDKVSATKLDKAVLDKRNTDDPTKDAQILVSGGISSDYEGSRSSAVIVGLCPDMCPESERGERERKGDLDKYERLDGDRNQTSQSIAVKKYNRTAEREANLIRPMPVLLKTIDHLLHLLEQPYNDNFLGIYNFLWDRMRAIRMDLRMQHIFNHESIIMLEQMIRFHVIAMHELCEFKKGEGFSEGFDAHLNIEQMNKTSVELFQMYDDHRKRGINVTTEKEFRGYYALLKLDKHPGYKVEPAELSLDLAKMTPDIRRTPEILYAREVARACRMGNYIAFFRLARKATYLDACLMHAHFAKLRTQALASLHSGLQNNQGIPIADIVKWLGMEGEDIESLVEYHGFVVKKYEQMYMVKAGPFLNIGTDFPTKCSQLVHLKRSARIVDDVYSSQTLSGINEEEEFLSDVVDSRSKTLVSEEMVDTEAYSVSKATTPTQPMFEEPSPTISDVENGDVTSCASPVDSRSRHLQQDEDRQVFALDGDNLMDARSLPKFDGSPVQIEVVGSSNPVSMIMEFDTWEVLEKPPDKEASTILHHNQGEAANEKLRFILRKWKRQASTQKEIREQKEFLANTALNSLSLGPPIRKINTVASYLPYQRCGLNIDYAAWERFGRRERTWSSLNVSELVAPILSARNSEANCVCWKVVIVVQPESPKNKAHQWLLGKLRGKASDDGLLVSLTEFSVWRQWINTHISNPRACLSVIREAMFDDNQELITHDEVISGTSSLVFVVSEAIPWETQRVRLNKLLISIPSGFKLPLLVVIMGTSLDEEEEAISRLGLRDISTFSVVSLVSDINGFFDDDRLIEGMKWLANHSAPQPSLHLVRTRDVILSYLRHSMDRSDVDPDSFVSAFNEALDRLSDEVIDAASKNPNHWPCRELEVLEKPSNERVLVDTHLPKMGWSSIEPLVGALKGCKLPSFPHNVFWKDRGFCDGVQIQEQKLAMRDGLVRYMTESTGLLNADVAAREAEVMLQKGAALELRGSSYHIVPRWPVIFRRIYNWRLMELSAGEFSSAYVLDRTAGNAAPMDRKARELTLDEMVEMSFMPTVSEPMGDVTRWTSERSEEVGFSSDLADEVADLAERNEERPVDPLAAEKERFTLLLRECNRVQDMIDQKLYIYF